MCILCKSVVKDAITVCTTVHINLYNNQYILYNITCIMYPIYHDIPALLYISVQHY